MVSLYQFKSDIQVVVLVVSLLLPPIVEELAFRHFILSALPFNANTWISWVAVLQQIAHARRMAIDCKLHNFSGCE